MPQKTLEKITNNHLLKFEDKETKVKILRYIWSTLNEIKNNDGLAFENLLKFKDIDKFINQQTNKLYMKNGFKISKNDIKHELIYQMYEFIRLNYKIYYDEKELIILICALRGWIGKRTTKNLIDIVKPIGCSFDFELSKIENGFSKILFYDVAKSTLTSSELAIFELYFEKGASVNEISKTLNLAKNTVYKRIDEIVYKIKGGAEL